MSKKKQHHEEHIDETWLIPYSDLLTLLLALFIVLFASSQVDKAKFNQMKSIFNGIFEGSSAPVNEMELGTDAGEGVTQVLSDINIIKGQIDEFIAENDLSNDLETTINYNDELIITIKEKVLFASGDANIDYKSISTINKIGSILEKYSNLEIQILGHTDNVPIHNEKFDDNWDLSSKRALNFMKVLLQNKKLDPSRFQAIGLGEFHPISTNDTVEGRASNRRVEVIAKIIDNNN